MFCDCDTTMTVTAQSPEKAQDLKKLSPEQHYLVVPVVVVVLLLVLVVVAAELRGTGPTKQ